VSGLGAGNYTLNVTTQPDNNHTAVTKLVNITVYKANSSVVINPIVNVTYGNQTVINFTVVNATEVTWNITDKDGNVVATGKGLNNITGKFAAGNYTITIRNAGTVNITGSSAEMNFTVFKANSSVVIDAIVNVTYGNQTVINFTVVNATEVTWNITDKDGNVVATGNDLNNITSKFAAGNYTITIRNADAVNITGSSAEMNFTVFKANSSVVIDTIVNVTYGNQTVINFTVVNATEVTWNITDKDGNVVVTGNDLNNITGKFAAGNYTITIRNAGTVNITGSSAEMNFTVFKAGSSVVINPIAKVTYGNETKINFTLVNATEVTWNITDKDGSVVATGKGLNNITKTLAAGNYTITIANADNQNYTGDIKSADFTVNKAPATLDVNDITFIEGDSGSSPITYTGESEVVGVIVDYKDAVVKIENNTITVSGLPESNYALNVTVYPDENHTGISKVVNVTVTKKSEDKMNVTSDSPVEGENATVTVNLPENTTGNVTVTLNNGSKYNATVKNGTASVNVPNLPAGDNNVTVTYTDDNGTSQSTTATIHVKKILIDASDMKRGWDSPYDYQAKLIDEDGKAIKGKTLTFTVNGKQYNATTDSNGIAKLTASKLAVGKYKITTAFPANGANTTKDLEIVKRLVENKDLTKDYLSSKHYTVRAIGDDGNPVGAGVVVTITTHGVTYKEKTDKNGYATLLIRLIPGKYTVKSTYHKYSVTNKLKVKQTLKLVKKTVKVKKGKKIVLKAKLKWSNGKAIKGKVIKFKFKGKTYKAKTNKKGIAKVTIKKKSVLKKLKKGKTYKYYGIYVKNKVKGKVKIKK
ncbi:Ig-like domain repeat protein, partial [Methanobrevibacter sp.]